MLLCTTQEATSSIATQRTSQHFTRKFITTLSRALYPEPDQFSPLYPILFLEDHFYRYPSTYVTIFPVVSFLPTFPPITYMLSFPPLSYYMPCPSHYLSLDHYRSIYTWWRVQVMKLNFLASGLWFSGDVRHHEEFFKLFYYKLELLRFYKLVCWLYTWFEEAYLMISPL
jgi:hypothetical protein